MWNKPSRIPVNLWRVCFYPTLGNILALAKVFICKQHKSIVEKNKRLIKRILGSLLNQEGTASKNHDPWDKIFLYCLFIELPSTSHNMGQECLVGKRLCPVSLPWRKKIAWKVNTWHFWLPQWEMGSPPRLLRWGIAQRQELSCWTAKTNGRCPLALEQVIAFSVPQFPPP